MVRIIKNTWIGDNVLHVVLKDLSATTDVGQRDRNVPIETARTYESALNKVSTTRLDNGIHQATHGSKLSGKLVAPMTMIPSFCRKPSISVRSWFRVCLMY